MSTWNVNSAVFSQASGPHGPSIPLPPWEPGFYGLGDADIPPQGQDLNWLGAEGVWGHDAILAPGQAQKFQVAFQVKRPIVFADNSALRGRIESRVEKAGVWTRCLKLSEEAMPVSDGIWVWVVGPRDRPMASSAISSLLRQAVLAEMPMGESTVTILALSSPALAAGFLSTPWPPVGLGDDLMDQLTRGFTNVSADVLCSPVFQATAAQGVARRYGEDQARAFRDAFRNATQFCDPRHQARAQALRDAEERRQAVYVGGGIALAAAAVVAVWYFGKKRTTNRRRNSRRRLSRRGRR